MNWQQTFLKLCKNPQLHAKFLNTLSMMEYIGARKIVKSQPEALISKETLSHMVEEIRHAQIFKKMVLKMDPTLASYGEEHVLAGTQGKNYLQAIDRGIEKKLGSGRPWENYLLSTLLIEERANKVYPFYEKILEPLGFGGLIRTILREEEHHLEEIEEQLSSMNLLSEGVMEELRAIEQKAFEAIIRAIEKSLVEADRPQEALFP